MSGGLFSGRSRAQPGRAKLAVSSGFAQFLRRLEPTASELASRLRHSRTVHQAIQREFGAVTRPERIGSHSRGTAIRGCSDVDLLVRIPKRQLTWGGKLVHSTTVLRRVREALEERFPDTTIRGDWPAVVAAFRGGDDAVDVVPAIYEGTTGRDGYPVFSIPGPDGSWLRASPQRHSRYLKQQIARSRGKLRGTIRLLKAWRFSRSPAVPVVGFHLEVLTAAAEICVGAKTYGECLFDALYLVYQRDGASLLDPLRLFGPISATKTEAQRSVLVSAARYAAEHAARALDAEGNGNGREAFRQWDIVFNGAFPAFSRAFR